MTDRQRFGEDIKNQVCNSAAAFNKSSFTAKELHDFYLSRNPSLSEVGEPYRLTYWQTVCREMSKIDVFTVVKDSKKTGPGRRYIRYKLGPKFAGNAEPFYPEKTEEKPQESKEPQVTLEQVGQSVIYALDKLREENRKLKGELEAQRAGFREISKTKDATIARLNRELKEVTEMAEARRPKGFPLSEIARINGSVSR